MLLASEHLLTAGGPVNTPQFKSVSRTNLLNSAVWAVLLPYRSRQELCADLAPGLVQPLLQLFSNKKR